MNFFKLFTKNRTRLTAGFAVLIRVVVVASVALAAPGGIIITPTQLDADVAIAPNFMFELEAPPQSLKEVPVWSELEQMLDNPYAVQLAADPHLAEEVSGFPAYETTIQRRRSYLPPGCDYDPATTPPACNDAALQPFLVHPLNYNPMNGEEMRLLNPNYEGGPFAIPDELVQCSGNPFNADDPAFCHVEATAGSLTGPVTSPADDTNRWVWVTKEIDVSAGDARVEETAIDFNSPMAPDIGTPYTVLPAKYDVMPCMVTTELVPPENSILCGGDPGEPGYAGFGVLDLEAYSVPAVPGVADPTAPIDINTQYLIDPAGCVDRNAELPGSCIPLPDGTGRIVRLLRPTIRNTANGLPDYLQNSIAELAEFGVGGTENLTPSNENDYFQGNIPAEKQAARDAAAVLGKAFFWDMQVGSDGVQACGTCHFVAGVDDRTKNQVNPNHIGVPADLTFQVAQPNEEVVATDFPLNPGEDVVGTNDVVSSMGVHFGMFGDIPNLGTGSFITNSSGVSVLRPDVRSTTLSNIDPIPGFAGTNGNEFRRVEPRNTPTLINADFNFDNFWDGRARHDFNGGSVFGAADPQAHIFACGDINTDLDECLQPTVNFLATRQIIRNVSLASLATGPGLSEFEMSQQGRNWSKIGKKLLQGSVVNIGGGQQRLQGSVTPLANQLVDKTDSVLGLYSNQGGSACAGLPSYDRSPSWSVAGVPGRPGLCISYPALIRKAFYPQLWGSLNRHLNGCYTDGRSPACPVSVPDDPFDHYVLSIATGGVAANNKNQFTQMEANFSLFWGLSIHAWGALLISDNAPFDQFMEANPDGFKSLGEANEPGLVYDMASCTQTGGIQPCLTESGSYKRDAGLVLNLDPNMPFSGPWNGAGQPLSVGTHQAGTTDPLLGFDFFYGFNLSGKNPEFRTTRCGECHAGGTTTDHTVEISNQLSFGDFVSEFAVPGVEIPIEPLGRNRVVSGFELEGELLGPAQDGVERRIANQSEVGLTEVIVHFPDGQSFFDNGMYNIGVTPCDADFAGNTSNCNDISRGGNDAFGFPLSLATLMMKNLGGVDFVTGTPMDTFDPDAGVTGGLFVPTAQDQQINPGSEDEPADPQLPAYLAPFASNITVGDESEQDEAGGGGGGMVNTVQQVPLLEGFVDTMGPFNPAATIGETFSMSPAHPMGTWMGGTLDPTQSPCYTDPTSPGCVNRVGRAGSFKAPGIYNVELTGPYFHNGGKLTLGQVVDFYMRGGDFAETNAVHRDFNIMDLLVDEQALGNMPVGPGLPTQDEVIVSLIDFVLTLTDSRVKYEQAPFDHPEIFVPLDGRAPENGSLPGAAIGGRPAFVNNTVGNCLVGGAGPCFRQIPAVGAAGLASPVDSFMGLTNIRPGQPGFNCTQSNADGPISQYCVEITP